MLVTQSPPRKEFVITTYEGSLLWTLEEIGRLTSGSGDPAETLKNIVNLIQTRFDTDVCSVYLLEADRTNLVLAATVGLRPESVGRVRMRTTEGLAGLVAQQLEPLVVADATRHPRFKYFREAGEDPYHSFLGVPLMDRGLLQGVLVVQTHRPARLLARRCADAADGRHPARADRRRSARARTVRRAGPPPARRARRRTCGGAGTTTPPACSASSIRRCGGVVDNNPVALLQRIPIERIEERASELALHSRINYAYRRMHEYLNSTPHLGQPARRRALGAAGRLLLGRVRAARVDSDLLGRPRHPGRRSHQERLRPRRAAGRRRPLLRPGLLPAAARRGRLAARGLHQRRPRPAADRTGRRRPPSR